MCALHTSLILNVLLVLQSKVFNEASIKLILFNVLKNKTLVTPAPTAASVIAKSGDCNNTQMIAIIDEYDMKTIIDVNVSLMKLCCYHTSY